MIKYHTKSKKETKVELGIIFHRLIAIQDSKRTAVVNYFFSGPGVSFLYDRGL